MSRNPELGTSKSSFQLLNFSTSQLLKALIIQHNMTEQCSNHTDVEEHQFLLSYLKGHLSQPVRSDQQTLDSSHDARLCVGSSEPTSDHHVNISNSHQFNELANEQRSICVNSYHQASNLDLYSYVSDPISLSPLQIVEQSLSKCCHQTGINTSSWQTLGNLNC